MGRFIAEERDSERRLNDVHKNVDKKLTRNNEDLLLQYIAERLNRVTTTIEEFEAVPQ